MSDLLISSLSVRRAKMTALREKCSRLREPPYLVPLTPGYYLRRLDRDHTAFDVGRAVNPDCLLGLRALSAITRETAAIDWCAAVECLDREIHTLSAALDALRAAKARGPEALVEAAAAHEEAEAQAKAAARDELARRMLAKRAEMGQPAPRAPGAPRGPGRPPVPVAERLLSISVRLNGAGRRAVRDPAVLPVLRELLSLPLDPAALADLRAWIDSRKPPLW